MSATGAHEGYGLATLATAPPQEAWAARAAAKDATLLFNLTQ